MKFIKLLFVISFSLFASEIKELQPKIGSVPNFSVAAQKSLELEGGDVWDVVGPGCSWYCGGGPKEVRASSCLDSANGISYKAGNAHDLSLKNAWVEGKDDYGIGEYLEYTFDNKSPRLTKIVIYNGYVKSDKAWKSNSRVKTLKLFVNEVHYANLQLKDSKAIQTFDVGTLGRRADGKDLMLKFEISEVYKGDKYKDVVITEIFFDGIDVH